MPGSVAASAAALVILWTGWLPVDPTLSVVVSLLVLRGAWVVAMDSLHILLEGTREGLELDAVRADLIEAVGGVRDGHHIHAWSISQERPMITLVARLTDGAVVVQTVAAIKKRLAERFGVGHATVEVDVGPAGTQPGETATEGGREYARIGDDGSCDRAVARSIAGVGGKHAHRPAGDPDAGTAAGRDPAPGLRL